MMNGTPLSPILYAKVLGGGSGGGGSLTPGTLVIVSGQLTEAQAEQFRQNIGAISADEIGTVFTIKGSVATAADLPASGNSVGDVYYVEEVSAGYVWIASTAHPNGYWEELGEPIDLSAYELKPTTVTVSGSTPTIEPADNTIYECGELTSLTIQTPPKTGSYCITFSSGSTATTLIVPASIQWANGETPVPAADTDYEINVRDNKAVYGAFPQGVSV